MTADTPEYAGFWIRVGASLIDTVLVVFLVLPLLVAIYGWSYFDMAQSNFVAGAADFLLSYVLPAIAVIMFWTYRQATPGKMVLKLKVVDAKTGGPLSLGQSIGRYVGYFVALFPFGLGILWVAFDARKQGWHDKMAGTLVIRVKKQNH